MFQSQAVLRRYRYQIEEENEEMVTKQASECVEIFIR